MTYPYVASPEKLQTLLKKISSEVGVPNKFDTKFIKSLGFTSSNDARLLSAIKFIGLADESGVPTDLWRQIRANPKKAIASGVRQGYADLFAHYPQAHLKDDEALRTFFSAQTTLGAQAVGKIVRTFKAFCELGDLSEVNPAQQRKSGIDATVASSSMPQSADDPVMTTQEYAEGLTVNINVQLQVPPDATGEIYDKFFQAMRKHLWPPQKK